VLSGRGLCDELITRPEESYRLWCVVVCDLETSRIGAPYIYNVRLLRVKHYSKDNFLDCLTVRMEVGLSFKTLGNTGRTTNSNITIDIAIETPQ